MKETPVTDEQQAAMGDAFDAVVARLCGLIRSEVEDRLLADDVQASIVRLRELRDAAAEDAK